MVFVLDKTVIARASIVWIVVIFIFDIMKGGTQGFPRHEVSDKQEVLFEDVSPSTAFSIRQQFNSLTN